MKKSEYNVIVSDEAHEDVINYIKYIVTQYQDYFAVVKILDDYHKTLASLRSVGGYLSICDFPKAKRNGIRKIRFKKYSFYLFYIINGSTINVIRGFQARQNYQKLL